MSNKHELPVSQEHYFAESDSDDDGPVILEVVHPHEDIHTKYYETETDSDYDNGPVVFEVVHDDDDLPPAGFLDPTVRYLNTGTRLKRKREIHYVDEAFIENKECECPLCLDFVSKKQVVQLNCGHPLCITCHTKCENSPMTNVANLCSRLHVDNLLSLFNLLCNYKVVFKN